MPKASIGLPAAIQDYLVTYGTRESAVQRALRALTDQQPAALARTLHGRALRDRLARSENERHVWLILEEALGTQQTGQSVGQP